MEGLKLNKGDIVYADLGQHPRSSVQSGIRPCVIISCNVDNHIEGNPIVNVCPCTTKFEKKKRKSHILITKEDVDGYLAKPSLILAEQTTTIDKSKIMGKTSRIVSEKVLNRIDRALMQRFSLKQEGDDAVGKK
jgi:mRNA interferase MazF